MSDIFTTLATPDQIRSAAGVSEQELSDAELTASGLDFDLEVEVAEWLPSDTSMEAIYVAGSADLASSQDKLLMYAISAYLKYTAAFFLFHNGIVRFPKKIADSNNTTERGTWDDDKVLGRLKMLANKYKTRFLELYDEPEDAFDTTIFAGIASPDFDPVTGA